MKAIINQSERLNLIFDIFKNFKNSFPKGHGKEFTESLSLYKSDANFDNILREKFQYKNNLILFRLKVEQSNVNLQGAMHGGAAATVLDVASTISTSVVDKMNRMNVSVDMNLQFLAPIKVNTEVLVACETTNITDNIALCTADILDLKLEKYLVKSQHTKAFIDKVWKI